MKYSRIEQLFAPGLVGCVLLIAILLAGCATPTSPALEEARATVESLKQNPEVVNEAPVSLHETEAVLSRAEKAWATEQDEDEVAHLAYIVKQKAQIAENVARLNASEDEAARLKEMRTKLRMEARTQEVELARKELAEFKAAQLEAEKTSRGTVLTLGDVLFDPGKSDLKPGGMQSIYRLVSFLKENPDRNALIEGHTDSLGSDELNLKLSEERAAAVGNFLIENGISSERVSSAGYGKTYPVASNETSGGRQQNRRVEIIVPRKGVDAAEVKRR